MEHFLPFSRIPSEAFTAGWVMDQLKESKLGALLLRLFVTCDMLGLAESLD